MKTLMAFLILALVVGCSNSRDDFRSEADELAYLEHLSNPTPSQWNRMKALQQANLNELARRNGLLREKSEKEQEEKDRLAALDQAKRVKEADQAAMQSWLDAEAQWQRAGDQTKAKEAREKAEIIRKSLTP